MARITKMERRGLDITKLINVFLKWAVSATIKFLQLKNFFWRLAHQLTKRISFYFLFFNCNRGVFHYSAF